ncbi:chemotaxis protein CheC [Geomonas sp.]|uniref:chemotaxis protein CheC n=1 Tax=Geomonas sp. TaxID=2651584 RepID=UPI002B484521|nr:chemotaxis protein CheC [Geomonas sp.]HJV35062.1 chemotaxis protein CheC [Geomonas sp.]
MATGFAQHAELDALTEACNIGMAHAATALSQLMGKGVAIQAPRLQVVEGPEICASLCDEPVRALHLQILGNVRGSIVILLKEADARRMLELLLGGGESAGPLNEMEVSTLKEVGNILASACLNALGLLLKMTLLPSVPTLVSGEAAQVLPLVVDRSCGKEPVFMVDTVFSICDTFCGGSLFLMPAPDSIPAMMSALK